MYDFPASPATGQVYQPAVGGPIWKFDGIAWASVQAIAGLAALKRTVVLATTSAFQFDPRTQYAEVEVQGGGGTASGGAAGAASQGTAGAGAGAGGYCKKLIEVTAAIRAATKTLTVGAGGTGGGSGAVGGAGGASSYTDGTNSMTANGGGTTTVPASSNCVSYSGGLGGTASGGDINRTGDQGGFSFLSLMNTNIMARAGAGGSSLFGSGGVSGGVTTTTATSTAGVNATGYGAGGSGGYTSNAGGAHAGGAGTQGVIVVTEYFFQQGGTGPQTLTADEENLIVNPDFIVSQENGTTAGTTVNYHFADQWYVAYSFGGALSVSQLVGANSVGRAVGKLVCTTADAAVAAGDYVAFYQVIEGLALRDLLWGTAGAAKSVVLRFSVYSNTAGTYYASIRNNALDRSFVMPFTHSGSGYQEYVFAIPGPQDGVWPADATRAVWFSIAAMAGTTYQAPSTNQWVNGSYISGPAQGNLMAAINNEMRIGRVGLYADPGNTGVPPPFKVPDFATELVRCQRYWEKSYNYTDKPGTATSSSAAYFIPTVTTIRTAASFRVSKRIAPAVTVYAADGTINALSNSGGGTIAAALTNIGEGSYVLNTSGGVAGNTYTWHYVANARM